MHQNPSHLWPPALALAGNKLKFQVMAICAIMFAGICANAAERAFVWSASTNITYDASGAETSENTWQTFYDQHGDPVRTISTAFIGNGIFGFDFRYYDTNVFIYSNDRRRSLLSMVDDSITLSNGIPWIEHATLACDKAGNMTERDAKSFGPDGSFQGETVTAFSYDKFGNLLYEEFKSLGADGAVTGRSTFTNTYVPRGHSFDRPPGVRRFQRN